MNWFKWICILFGIGLFALVVPPRDSHAQSQEEAIIRNINNFRASLGLPAFTYNAQLAVAAQNQADFLADRDIFTHTGYGGSRPFDRAVAAGYSGYVSENIVGGWRMTPADGVVWWRNSPPHYNTITSTRYTQIGAGFSQGHEKNFYTIVVGLPDNAPSFAQTNSASISQPAPLIITPIALNAPSADGSITHEIQNGQALWSLAAYYKVDLDFILRINNLGPNDFVQPGDDIRIQLANDEPTPTPLPTATPVLRHTVQSGETPWEIVSRYGLDLDEFMRANNKSPNALLSVGESLLVRWVPGSIPQLPTATPQYYYTIVEGDTLWTLAANNGLTLDELYALNGIDSTYLVQPGTALLIVPLPEEGNGQLAIVNEELPTGTPVAVSVPTVGAVGVQVVTVPIATVAQAPTVVAEVATPVASITSVDPQRNENRPLSSLALPIGLVMVALLLGVVGFMLYKGNL